MGIVADISVIIITALFGSIFFVYLGLPPLLGYIAAGILIGPHLGIISLTTLHDIEALSELGVALLLFALGLEFSLSQLKSVRNIAVFGTALQIILTILIGYLTGQYIGLSYAESVAFGALISVSSTVVVLKNLFNLGLLSTLSAKVMIGILLVQDLAVIPLMLIIPQLASKDLHATGILLALLKALFVILVAVSIGSKLLPWFMGSIARRNSRELFIISIITVALGVSYLGSLLGFSYAFGAFIAGIALSESDHQHRALSDIIPLRDLFVLIFFVSVGMMMDPGYLFTNIGLVLMVLMVVMTAKAAILYAICRIFKYQNVIPIAVALGLCQIGEFSFALAQLAMHTGTISGATYNLIVSIAVLSITLSPFLAWSVRPVYSFMQKNFNINITPLAEMSQIDVSESEVTKHILIIGGGRVGYFVARTLQQQGKHPVIIEDNYQTAIKLKDRGLKVLFGDASNLSVLEAAKYDKAILVLIAMADQQAVKVILQHLKIKGIEVPLIARAHSQQEMKWLRALGVDRVVEPFFEAGLEMSMQALSMLAFDNERIARITEELREQVYQEL